MSFLQELMQEFVQAFVFTKLAAHDVALAKERVEKTIRSGPEESIARSLIAPCSSNCGVECCVDEPVFISTFVRTSFAGHMR